MMENIYKKFSPHRWTINAFSDGSAMWLLEWKNELEYRTVSFDGFSEWEEDEAYPQYRGYSNDPNKLTYDVALNIAKCMGFTKKHHKWVKSNCMDLLTLKNIY